MDLTDYDVTLVRFIIKAIYTSSVPAEIEAFTTTNLVTWDTTTIVEVIGDHFTLKIQTIDLVNIIEPPYKSELLWAVRQV